ncbi:hypothetical protein [Mesorhizobium sp. M1403]|uniref:hypothetical protein n=1 Tax=unclassified Mesorhizobium TaxID=325217 RepID=UPI00333924F9
MRNAMRRQHIGNLREHKQQKSLPRRPGAQATEPVVRQGGGLFDAGRVIAQPVEIQCMSRKSVKRFCDNDMHQDKNLKRVA